MPTELLLAPVGSGKTEYALQQIRDTIENQPFAPIWVLLPGRRQEDAMRQRLVEQSPGRKVYFNVSFFNFYTLYARLLDIVGKPQRELDENGRVRLLRGLLATMEQNQQLSVFHSIAHRPGFAQVIADFIYELKQNIVYPDPFLEFAKTGSDKDRDLAAIYARYQDMLRENNLVDREGEGWLALDEVKQQQTIGQDVALLIVDGFDQFNPLQIQLLVLLGSRAQRTLMTLPTVVGRESSIGRRFHEVRQRLTSAFQQAKVGLTVSQLSAPVKEIRHEGIRHLNQYSFLNNAPTTAGNGCIKLIEAPDPKTEAFAVMRQIKRLLLEGCHCEEILVAVRDWSLYAPHMSVAAARYGIPSLLHHSDSLANNPAVIALLNAVELARYNFPRRAVMDVLRSPYFVIPGIDLSLAERLDYISQTQQVIGGKDEWLTSIKAAAQTTTDEFGETQDAALEQDAAAALDHALRHFFEGITPLVTSHVHEYIVWLENLIGVEEIPDDEPLSNRQDTLAPYSLQMVKQVSQQTNSAYAGRDMQALQSFKHVLRSMLATENLFTEVNLLKSQQTTWHDFLRDLKQALSRTPLQNNANRSGHVLITSVTDARGLPHDHVFIPGLSEGIFPRPPAEDSLYLDSERQALIAAGITLETQRERIADEGLFYELISLPRQSITLSRPTVQTGAIWPESHLWRAIRVICSDASIILDRHRLTIGGTIRPDEAAHRTEVSLVVAEGLQNIHNRTDIYPLYNWLLHAEPAHWNHIIHGRRIEKARILNQEFDSYSGKLRRPELLHWVAQELGDKRIWSASQFNDYGACGFRFFAKRLLKLEALEEPETGMDNLQRGTLIHALLEETYRELAKQAISIIPEHLETALNTLRRVADHILPNAPLQFGFRESPLWQQEQAALLRKIEALVRSDFSSESPLSKAFKGDVRYPYLMEQPLGNSSDKPMQLDLGKFSVRVNGYIDRIDRIGDRLIVIDYKSGTSAIPTSEMAEGHNYQMMIYVLAGERLIAALQATDANPPQSMAGGTFFHLNRNLSGTLDMDNSDDRAALDDARLQLARQIQQGREGEFKSAPNRKGSGACNHYCDYIHLCRINIMNPRKRL